MATYDLLPLQCKINLDVRQSEVVRVKQVDILKGVSETLRHRVNPVKRTWDLSYIPLNFEETSIVRNFLFFGDLTRIFTYTTLLGETVNGSIKINSYSEIGSKKGKTIIKFSIEERF